MAKNILLASQAKSAKCKNNGKPKKHNDGEGLYLICFKSGLKSWRYDFKFNDKRQTLTYGSYPDLSLSAVRDLHTESLVLKGQGINPAEQKQKQKYKLNTHSFNTVADEWLEKKKHKWVKKTLSRKKQVLRDYVSTHIGVMPVNEIEPPEVFHLLSIIENKGMIDTAHMVKQTISQVLRYAVATGRVKRDVSADLDGALKEVNTKNLPAITEPEKVGQLLRDVNNYPNGKIHIQFALKILPYIFIRNNELRKLKWDYVNFEEGIIDIPKEAMKGVKGKKLPHVVPMSRQVVTLLNGLMEYTGKSDYLFPNSGGKNPSMSENAINNALRKLDYDTENEMCGHGFRTIFSTSSYDEKYSTPKGDWIEMQLAHVDKNQVKLSYNKGKYLKQRALMMQQYADYLDVLRTGANVIPLKRKA